MRKKKLYGIEIVTKTENSKGRSIYLGYKKIKYEYDREQRTLRIVLTDDKGKEKIVEKVNVESVEKYSY